MTARASKKSTKADNMHAEAGRQRADASAFGERLRSAMARISLKNAELARRAGVSPQMVSEYTAGAKIAGADNLFSLADALGVRPRWLIRGEGEMLDAVAADNAGFVNLPRYDVFQFGEYGKGVAEETVQLPASWLQAAVKTTSGLWIAEMPSDALPSVAREGETIICRDPETPLQDRRVYIFLLDGRPIVRRVAFQPNQVVLRGEDEADTITLRPEELEERLMPAGRILATVRLDQV